MLKEVGHGSHKESFDIFPIMMVQKETLFPRFDLHGLVVQ